MASISAYQLILLVVLPLPNDSSKAVAADFGLLGPSVLNEKKGIVLNLFTNVDSEKSTNAKWSDKVLTIKNLVDPLEVISEKADR